MTREDERRGSVLRLESPGDGGPVAVAPLRVCIIIPVYDDWISLASLLESIDRELQDQPVTASVLAINDKPGAVTLDGTWAEPGWSRITQLEVLHLTRNLGHQRAIAVGLSHIEATSDCDCVAVMDADGEDRPEDLRRLIDHFRSDPSTIVVAARHKRSEGLLFRCCYWLYKLVFRSLTGKTIDFGNFCLIPRSLLTHIVSMSEIWGNFPAGLIQSRLPLYHLATRRGIRYHGKSNMNFLALLIHGLGAISVFSDAVFVRVTLLSGALFVVTIATVATVLALKLFGQATPGWASNLAVSLGIFAIQMIVLSVVAAFLVLNNRTSTTVIPRVSYRNFLLRCDIIYAAKQAESAVSHSKTS